MAVATAAATAAATAVDVFAVVAPVVSVALGAAGLHFDRAIAGSLVDRDCPCCRHYQ